ncbi:MAG: signal peptidase I [Clostridiales bacterium]|nr:signal peptidase I [Clostridiales bacterium]
MSENNTDNITYEDNITEDADVEGINLTSEISPELYEKKKESNDGVKKFVTTRSEGVASNVYDWVRCVLFAFSIILLCIIFLFRLVNVEGSSMNDTLTSNDKVVVTNLFYEPHNNDIIVISHGAEYSKPIIKRVIATEGQSIELDYENDRIIVDGVVLDEVYIDDSTFEGNVGDNEIPDVVPEGKIFVMGDNRRASMDSRSTEIGLIDVENVIGKAQFVVFPFNHFGYLY